MPALPAPHHTIQRLRVTGGFLSGLDVQFADGLNCFIGGRGAGKTTALEFLRYALGLMPDQKTHSARNRAIETLVASNLGSGRLAVEIQTKAGIQYTAGRAHNESVQVLNELGTAVPISLDRDQVFSADVLSQNEIESIALDPAAQLALFDRFREVESARLHRELGHLARQLEQSTNDLLTLDSAIEELGGRAAEVPVYEEKLRGLLDADGPDSVRISAGHDARVARATEARYSTLLIGAMQKVAREVAALDASFQATAIGQIGAPDAGPNAATMERLRQEGEAIGNALATFSASLNAAVADAERRIVIEQQSLAAAHAVQEAEYRALLAQVEEAGGRAAERTRLQALLTEAQAAARERTERGKQRDVLLDSRRELLSRVSELRDERFALRQQVADQLNRDVPGLRVTVTQSADLNEYRDRLAEMLKGSGVRQNVVAERLVEMFLPGELARHVLNRDHAAIARGTSYDDDRARRILETLFESGAAYALETIDIHDRPCIELRDGDVFKESSHLSTGQRCTTILPILLIQSERPLLIDQPEDNLDNAFVFETIVKALKAVKGSRQVIFVTHNPNIPVLGEAERVFVFASDGEHATVRRTGTVDECKDDIELILEGGREAFEQRMARYGH